LDAAGVKRVTGWLSRWKWVGFSDGRVTAARKYGAGGAEQACARVDYSYGTNPFDGAFTQNGVGRLAATRTGCAGVGAGEVIEMYSYTVGGAVAKKRLRLVRPGGSVNKDVSYTYGADGKLATVLYPDATIPYTYSYNQMDQPVGMTGPMLNDPGSPTEHARNVAYNAAGQVTSMQYLQGEEEYQGTYTPVYYTESRTYNVLQQLERQTTTGNAGVAADIEYLYPVSGNNGRITGRKNHVSGEQVNYGYDSLNRLIAASVAGSGGWGQTFAYDGFGNLWTQAVTKGTAPVMQVNVDLATNRINTAGWGYDANGNTTQMPGPGNVPQAMEYDVDNRLVGWTQSGQVEQYQYLADNKRVWKKAPNGVETVYFYGVGGQKLITYGVQGSPFVLVAPVRNVYFGGKVIRADGEAVVQDRLGSVVARGSEQKDYFPYGDTSDERA
jgi:hypothetical protein